MGAIDATYLGLAANSNVTVTSAAAVFAGPTVHVAATSGGAAVQLTPNAVVTVVMPLTVSPSVPGSAALLLPSAASGAGRRAAVASQDAATAAAGNYSVACPVDEAAYASGDVVVDSGCSMGSHSVTCSASEAGGTKSGQCPVDGFTAACLVFDEAASAWAADKCSVTDVSNDYLTCDCASGGAIAPSFATVTRPATTNFVAAPVDGDDDAPGADTPAEQQDDEEGSPLESAGSIVALVIVAIIVVSFLVFVVHKKMQMDKVARDRANRSKLYVAGAGAAAVPVDADDETAAGQADAANKESLGQYRAAASAN